MRFIPLLCLALAATGGWVRVATPAPYNPRVGAPHIDFVLPRIDDRHPFRLAHLHGQKVLLIQFASW